MEYLLHNATIVTGKFSRRGSIAVSGERIKDIWLEENGLAVPSDPDKAVRWDSLPGATVSEHPACRVLDLSGKMVLAGGIDAHVHFREPGMTHKADMESESEAALLGGVTSFIDMPNTSPPTISAERLWEKLALAGGRCHANYGFHIGATNSNLTEIDRIIRNGWNDGAKTISKADFGGIKVFMGSSTGNMLVDDGEALAGFFRESEKTVLVHSEDEAIIRENLAAAEARYGVNIPFRAHKDIRSRSACIKSTARALELAMKYGTRLHILHVSTREETEMIRAAKTYSPHITAETSANYLWFCSDDYDRMGSRLKCNPSVKDAGDRSALRQALKSGIIDTIGSDHAPHLAGEKDRKYLSAPSGLPSVRQTLPVLMTVAAEEEIPAERIASVFSEKAAEMFGIRERGFLKPGYYADITIVDPDKEWIISQETDGYRCGWTPYEGVRLRGRVEYVFINGKLAVENGKMTDCQTAGQRLEFG